MPISKPKMFLRKVKDKAKNQNTGNDRFRQKPIDRGGILALVWTGLECNQWCFVKQKLNLEPRNAESNNVSVL